MSLTPGAFNRSGLWQGLKEELAIDGTSTTRSTMEETRLHAKHLNAWSLCVPQVHPRDTGGSPTASPHAPPESQLQVTAGLRVPCTRRGPPLFARYRLHAWLTRQGTREIGACTLIWNCCNLYLNCTYSTKHSIPSHLHTVPVGTSAPIPTNLTARAWMDATS